MSDMGTTCKIMVPFSEIVTQPPMLLEAGAKREMGLLGLGFCDLYGAMSANATDRRHALEIPT